MGGKSWRWRIGCHGGELGEESVRLTPYFFFIPLVHDVPSSSTSCSKIAEVEMDEVVTRHKRTDDRTQPSQLLSDTPLPARPVKPHDWTYSSCHTGQIAGPSVCLLIPHPLLSPVASIHTRMPNQLISSLIKLSSVETRLTIRNSSPLQHMRSR